MIVLIKQANLHPVVWNNGTLLTLQLLRQIVLHCSAAVKNQGMALAGAWSDVHHPLLHTVVSQSHFLELT